MIVVNNIFEIGQVVYLKTDQDQKARIITALIVYKAGDVEYKLTCGTDFSYHLEFEMSADRDTTKMIIE